MKKIVLDSCVFNKLFLNEFDRDEAIKLIDFLTTNSYKILVPDLFLYEVLAVAGGNNYPIKEAYLIIKSIKNLHFVNIEENFIDKAIEICESGNQKSGFPSFYDSSYHSIAIENQCLFITSDKKHLAKTLHFGNIVFLENWEREFKNNI